MSAHINEVQINDLRLAHSILASLAWVIFFPAGAISIRLWNHRLSVWVHGITQIFAYVLFIAAVGIGIKLALELDAVGAVILTSSHSIIGLVIFGLVAFQPILWYAHHLVYKKHSRRTVWAQAHLWLGRILITLAIINGGLGFWITTPKYQKGIVKGEIVYGVIAGVVWIVYVAAAVFGEVRKARSDGELLKQTASPSDSESEKGQVSVEAGKSNTPVWKGGQLVSH